VQTLKALETMAAAFTETAQAAKGRIEDRPGLLRRVVAPFGGTLSVLADAVTLHGRWLGPTGAILAARLQPLLDKVLALFA
jgi:hypothetical protein